MRSKAAGGAAKRRGQQAPSFVPAQPDVPARYPGWSRFGQVEQVSFTPSTSIGVPPHVPRCIDLVRPETSIPRPMPTAQIKNTITLITSVAYMLEW